MKLTYRGHSYETSAPNQSGASVEQTKVKMIYRGHSYYAVPGSSVAAEAVETSVSATLIYRGHTYERKLRLPKIAQTVRAFNWRYQSA